MTRYSPETRARWLRILGPAAREISRSMGFSDPANGTMVKKAAAR